MKGKIIARRLNVVLIGLILCGIFVYGVFLPLRGHHMAMMAKGGPFDGAFWPWLLYLWGTAVPCVVAVGYAFSITHTLREGRMFTPQNARRLLMIARWAIGDTVYFFIGQILLFAMGWNHPGVFLMSLFIVFAGAAIATAARALAWLVQKAAELQEESDWTI